MKAIGNHLKGRRNGIIKLHFLVPDLSPGWLAQFGKQLMASCMREQIGPGLGGMRPRPSLRVGMIA